MFQRRTVSVCNGAHKEEQLVAIVDVIGGRFCKLITFIYSWRVRYLAFNHLYLKANRTFRAGGIEIGNVTFLHILHTCLMPPINLAVFLEATFYIKIFLVVANQPHIFPAILHSWSSGNNSRWRCRLIFGFNTIHYCEF